MVCVQIDQRIMAANERHGRHHRSRLVTIGIMRVTIQLPDDISAALEEKWDDGLVARSSHRG